MKKQSLLPIGAAAGGLVALLVRIRQNHAGFEVETGLPLPGNFAGIALVFVLLLLGLLLFLLCRFLPKENTPAFPADFSVDQPQLLFLPVAGAFLFALSGAIDLLQGLGLLETLSGAVAGAAPLSGTLVFSMTDFSPRSHVLMGVLSLASAAGLFLSAAACRPQGRGAAASAFSGTWLLIPVAALVVRLVWTYRADSVNPALSAYYVELLALIFSTLAFYRLSSFAFGSGQTFRFAWYACAAVVLCITAVADNAHNPGALVLYVGSAVTLLGFLALRVSHRPSQENDV